jgi:hypothetical protein
MANFTTHFAVAVTASAMASTAYLGTGLITAQNALLLTVAGTLGGILPDIDSDNSRPLQMIFISLYLVFVFGFISTASDLSIMEFWVILGLGYYLAKNLFLGSFKKWTKHRGIFHSIIAGILFWLIATVVCSHLFKMHSTAAWMIGFFIFLGFLIHLLLDEFYSVDFENKRLKRSFGTAFKLVDHKNWSHTAIFIVGVIVLSQLVPETKHFTQFIFSLDTYEAMLGNFLPTDFNY